MEKKRFARHPYKPEYLHTILNMLCEGKTLKEITLAIGVDINSLQIWRDNDADFDAECTRALTHGFEVLADSLINICEIQPDSNKARITSDNIKWVLSKRAVARYGDRLEVNVNGSVDIRGAIDEAKRRALPASYQQQPIDSELIEVKQLSTDQATDQQTVAPLEPREKTIEDLL